MHQGWHVKGREAARDALWEARREGREWEGVRTSIDASTTFLILSLSSLFSKNVLLNEGRSSSSSPSFFSPPPPSFLYNGIQEQDFFLTSLPHAFLIYPPTQAAYCARTYKAFLKCSAKSDYAGQGEWKDADLECPAEYFDALEECRGTALE